MFFIKLLVVVAALFWLGRVVGRLLMGGLTGRARRGRREGASDRRQREGRYDDLTRQKISDADFEEISEE